MKFGLTLLDELRPPPDYVVSVAIGTTYSLDLVTCAAAILALSGRNADEADVPVPVLLRALKQLEGRLHFVVQRGCIMMADTANAKLVALLDRIVTGVALPPSGSENLRRTFHPKVWLVRYVPRSSTDDCPTVWRMIVSSRNLTSNDAWDLGVCLHGVVAQRHTNVPNVRGFATHVLALKRGVIDKRILAELDSVTWTLPAGIKSARFGWNKGASRRTIEAHPADLPAAVGWILLVAPFLSPRTVAFVAKRWRALPVVNRLLVGGFVDLEKVARVEPDALRSLSPRFLDAVTPEQVSDAGTSAEMEEDSRGLHAKVVAVWHDNDHATVMLGSPNLTVEGWEGSNCEAWMVLKGDATIANHLWSWAENRTREFDLDAVPKEATEDDVEALALLHDSIARQRFTLNDVTGALECSVALGLSRGVTLAARRITQAASVARWRDGSGIELGACEGGERTRFIAMTLRSKNGSKSWIQDVDVSPVIDVARDEATFRDLVASSAHLWSYVWGVLDDASLDGDGLDTHEEGEGVGDSSSRSTDHGLWLEPLLAALARARADGRIESVLATIDAAIASHRNADAREPRIQAFVQAWDAIRGGFS